MRFIFVSVLVLAIVLQVQASLFSVNTTAKACKRSVSYAATPKGEPTTLKFISVAACRFGKKGVAASASAIVADLNVVGRPDLSIGVFRADKIVGDYSSALSGFRLVLERVIEYDNRDGMPGYQPEEKGDRPCDNGITLLATVGWSAFNISSTADDSNNTYYTAVSTSSNPAFFTLTAQFTTVAMSNGKIDLDPSSFKFDFDIADYVYKNASCASGLAFRIYIISAGESIPKPDDVTINTDVDLSSQDAVDITNAAGTSVGSFFVWDKTVTDVNGSSIVLHSNLSSSDGTDDSSADLDVPATFHSNLVWFSVEGQVTTFSWDPYAMVDDSIVSDTSSSEAMPTSAPTSAPTAHPGTTSSVKVSSNAPAVVVEILMFAFIAIALLL